MLPVQAEFLSPFRSILSAWCRQLVRLLRLVSVSLLPSTHLQPVLLCPLACFAHPAALLKINNSSLLSAPISSRPLPDVTHEVLSFPQKPPGFSWPLVYQRSQALQPHSLGDAVTMPCYSFQWTSLPEFSAKGSKSKGVSMMTEIPQMPCRVGLEMLRGGDSEYVSCLFADRDVSWVQVSGQPGSHLRKKFYCFWKGWNWKTRCLSAEYLDAWEFACLLFKIKKQHSLVPAAPLTSSVPSLYTVAACAVATAYSVVPQSHPVCTPFCSHSNSSQRCN